MKFQNKSVIVTGGSRGIGKAIAKTFLKEGANVIVNYRSNDAAANEALEEFKDLSDNVFLFKGDVVDFKRMKELTKFAVKKFGRIDILINSAGIVDSKLLMMTRPEDYYSVIETNLIGTINCCRTVLSKMVAKKYGRIINISSAAAQNANPGQSYYAASKAGVNAFTKAIAKEHARFGITVNAIAPGFIKTDMSEKFEEDAVDDIPLKRFGNKEDVASFVSFIASDEASYCTGQVYIIDGGLLA